MFWKRSRHHQQTIDIWTRTGEKLRGLVPENYIIYGEIIGWAAPGVPIQKNYQYCLPDGTSQLVIYRIAVVNSQGTLADLSWDAVKEFCGQIGVPHVPELFRCYIQDLTNPIVAGGGVTLLDELMDVKYRDQYHQALPLDPEAPADEGVCIRIEGMVPTIVKAKSPVFLAHETKMLDEDVVDIEADEATLSDDVGDSFNG